METGKKILIIEDDQEISMLLRVILRKANIETVQAYSGTEGLLQLQNNTFDLILLDLMLPGKSGEELIREVREKSSIPIIVISAKSDIENKVQVLKMGADDYITKPFHQEEVLARVEVQLRKASFLPTQQTELEWRGLKNNIEERLVTLNGHELQLTNAEFDMISFFMQNPERALSKKEIYESIWKGTYYGDDNTISVHVSNLRKKFSELTSEEYIKTIWGAGFMLV
ncbi:response regulator transcription factor [Ornithinibacillus halotolerans]|uniref:DNA-binding response regulator n=1 Tax=Ornithinibacillus halotolerans TaxID=1274357 RepID=A0A916WDA7_9BACI|nr:response regulator transcription factor [Ornithinibacillus halotolerans]GGA90341.1 DNA-binding response regulator [Ornithinibacillus halotolerans]